VAKFENRAKRNARGAKVYEAPVEWVELLRQAVEDPGIISKAYSLFHNYSLGNQLMALSQLMGRRIAPGPIASYGRWVELGRQVRKGETAVIMLVPRTFKKTVEGKDGEDEERTGRYFAFRPTAFSFAQTEPIEGKEDRSSELTVPAPDWSMQRALAVLEITERSFDSVSGNKQGYSLPQLRSIHINPVAENPDKTRLHEIAHLLMHQNGYDGSEHRGVVEFEAECTAFIVSTVLGFAAGAESRGYCQEWLRRAGQQDVTEKTVNKIMSAAQKILKAGQPAKDQPVEQDAEAAA
jgi:antirestriction protein ArdC